MILLVEPFVECLGLRIELGGKRVDRIREGIHVRTVARLMVFITRQDKLLKLVKKIDLIFHIVVGC